MQLEVGSVERGAVTVPGRTEFPAARSFRVEVDGVVLPGVVGVLPIGSQTEVGSDGSARSNAQNLTLLVAPTADPTLHEWFREVSSGKDIRKSISVVLVGRRGGEARRYTLLACWPCRWQAPELNSTTDTHLVGEIEFAVEKVERK